MNPPNNNSKPIPINLNNRSAANMFIQQGGRSSTGNFRFSNSEPSISGANDNLRNIVLNCEGQLDTKDVDFSNIAVPVSNPIANPTSQANDEIIFVFNENQRRSIKRSILALREPEFEINHRNVNEIKVENTTTQGVFDRMFAYLQTGYVDITLDCAVALLFLADDLNFVQLKKAVFKFIIDHPEVRNTDEYKQIFKRPTLAQQMFEWKQ